MIWQCHVRTLENDGDQCFPSHVHGTPLARGIVVLLRICRVIWHPGATKIHGDYLKSHFKTPTCMVNVAIAIYRFHFSVCPLIAAQSRLTTYERIRHRTLMGIYVSNIIRYYHIPCTTAMFPRKRREGSTVAEGKPGAVVGQERRETIQINLSTEFVKIERVI